MKKTKLRKPRRKQSKQAIWQLPKANGMYYTLGDLRDRRLGDHQTPIVVIQDDNRAVRIRRISIHVQSPKHHFIALHQNVLE